MENNEEKSSLSASFFVTFFREKKVEFVSLKRLTLWGERVSLSGVLFREEYPLERSFVVYRLSDCVWWWFGRLLLRRTCAFSLVKVKVLFFPLCIEEELHVLPHTKAKLSHLS